MAERHYQFMAKTDQIPENRVSCFEVDGHFVVASQFDGKFYAVTNKCSHADQSFTTGRVRGHRLLCPLHGAIFDIRDGSVLSAPAIRPIRSYPVKVEGDDVLISVDQSAGR